MADVVRLPPYSYIHVLDNNTNVTRVECGPQTFINQDHEHVVEGPKQMVTVPPRSYCIISNPAVFDDNGLVVLDRHNQVKLRHGDQEVRFHQEPFPLYPGESVYLDVTALTVVPVNSALRLVAVRDFQETVNGADIARVAGDEWLFCGPGTFLPRIEVEVEETVNAFVIKSNQALRLRARRTFSDASNTHRKAGEEWLVRDEGAYLPAVYEEVIDTVDAYTMTDKTALHLRAVRTYTDVFGTERKAGEEWLVTFQDAEVLIPDVYEEVVGEVTVTTLTCRQFTVIVDPVDAATGKPQLGKRVLRKGEASFFLQPGERLEIGIQDVYVLREDEALLLRAEEEYEEGDVTRRPGDRWMVNGPCDYVPSIELEVVERRHAIPLDENEGIYVRDIRSGKVRSVIGQTYMLSPNEELWKKELLGAVEELLAKDKDPVLDRTVQGRARAKPESNAPRDMSRVVTFRAPHNSAVQVYDYKTKTARVCFGPDLVMLQRTSSSRCCL